MGSQVNFYMVPEDEEDFLLQVVADPETSVLWAMNYDRPIVTAEFPLPSAYENHRGWLVLWNHCLVSREQITPPNKVPDRACTSGRYDINPIVYPVVEFMRSAVDDKGLAPGRIWTGFEDWHDMPEDRMKLYRSWFRRLARRLNKWPYRWGMYRIGPKTKEYFDAGGRAVGYAIGKPICIKKVGETKVIHSRPEIRSEHPQIENDAGEDDLTIER